MSTSLSRDVAAAARPLPRSVHLRRGTLDDEPATFDVMRRAVGLDMSWNDHLAARQHMRTSPHSSYWLAEETLRFGKTRVVAYAHSMVRDRVWHLTEFFVYPSHQKQGIGGALLAHCLEDGAQAGAETRMILASSHPAADALYIRQANCFPRVPMLLLSGPLLSLQPLVPEEAPIHDSVLPASLFASFFPPAVPPRQHRPPLVAEPILLTPEVQQALDALDRDTVGYARPPEHVHWVDQMGGRSGAARLFRRQMGDGAPGELVGYAYFGPHSTGPAAALDPYDLPRMLTHVTTIARMTDHTDHIGGDPLFVKGDPYWAVAGTNEVVLRWLLRCGWQIIFQYLFMSSRPLGNLDRYVCHNPLHFL
jgi:GNAT superfamily N-acetyltransferase